MYIDPGSWRQFPRPCRELFFPPGVGNKQLYCGYTSLESTVCIFSSICENCVASRMCRYGQNKKTFPLLYSARGAWDVFPCHSHSPGQVCRYVCKSFKIIEFCRVMKLNPGEMGNVHRLSKAKSPIQCFWFFPSLMGNSSPPNSSYFEISFGPQVRNLFWLGLGGGG